MQFTVDRVVDILHNLILFLFSVGWIIAAIMIIWFAIQLMFSANNPTRYATAKKGIWYAIIGAAILMAANILVDTLLNIFG
jgi:hypothetical protein